MCLSGVSFVSQDMPTPLPHPPDPTDPTDPSDSPETTESFKSLKYPDSSPRRHCGFFAFLFFQEAKPYVVYSVANDLTSSIFRRKVF